MRCCLWFRLVLHGPWPKCYGYHLSIYRVSSKDVYCNHSLSAHTNASATVTGNSRALKLCLGLCRASGRWFYSFLRYIFSLENLYLSFNTEYERTALTLTCYNTEYERAVHTLTQIIILNMKELHLLQPVIILNMEQLYIL